MRKKRRSPCNGAERDGVARPHHPTRKRADFRKVFHDENTCGIRPKEEKQMTVEPPTAENLSAVDATGASFHGVTDWHAIDWKSANHNVCRLQARIVKATQEGKWGKVKALQRLLALDPVAETTADPNSYGFRPARSTADAIEQCFCVLGKQASPQWILEGDIKGCFDHAS